MGNKKLEKVKFSYVGTPYLKPVQDFIHKETVRKIVVTKGAAVGFSCQAVCDEESYTSLLFKGMLPKWLGRAIPILFSGDMVNAILAGRKTMTRRIFKKLGDKCPYGKVGDVLWVREKFRLGVSVFDEDFYYAADCSPVEVKRFKWKPSIFMPKRACRIFLQVIDIRIERLNDISKSDARKEGINRVRNVLFGDFRYTDYLNPSDQWRCPVSSFQSLWQKINGMDSWDKNPWVWVISFKRIEKP